MLFKYQITGMHCNACIEKITAALSPHYQLKTVMLKPPILEIEASQAPNLNELNSRIANAGKYALQPSIDIATTTSNDEQKGILIYYPIFLIAAYILGVASINNIHAQSINWLGWMQQFMAGFFLVFSAFKLLDLPGFAEGYATYDLLAKYWHDYGYIYPFIELSLGIL